MASKIITGLIMRRFSSLILLITLLSCSNCNEHDVMFSEALSLQTLRIIECHEIEYAEFDELYLVKRANQLMYEMLFLQNELRLGYGVNLIHFDKVDDILDVRSLITRFLDKGKWAETLIYSDKAIEVVFIDIESGILWKTIKFERRGRDWVEKEVTKVW